MAESGSLLHHKCRMSRPPILRVCIHMEPWRLETFPRLPKRSEMEWDFSLACLPSKQCFSPLQPQIQRWGVIRHLTPSHSAPCRVRTCPPSGWSREGWAILPSSSARMVGKLAPLLPSALLVCGWRLHTHNKEAAGLVKWWLACPLWMSSKWGALTMAWLPTSFPYPTDLAEPPPPRSSIHLP